MPLRKNFLIWRTPSEAGPQNRFFFQAVDNTAEENSTIFMIKDYISQMYMNETLSVKDISDHVFFVHFLCVYLL